VPDDVLDRWLSAGRWDASGRVSSNENENVAAARVLLYAAHRALDHVMFQLQARADATSREAAEVRKRLADATTDRAALERKLTDLDRTCERDSSTSQRYRAGLELVDVACHWTVDALAVPGQKKITDEMLAKTAAWSNKASGRGKTRLKQTGAPMKDVNVGARQAADEIRSILEYLRQQEAVMDYRRIQRAKRDAENEKRYGTNRANWPKRARGEDAAEGDDTGLPHLSIDLYLERCAYRTAEILSVWAERDDWTDETTARVLAKPRVLTTAEDRDRVAEDLVCAVAGELGVDPKGFFTADETAKKRKRKRPVATVLAE
jgi:hypothetical protein